MPMMLVTALALKTGLCHSGLCSKLAGLNLGCSRRGFGAKGTGQDLDILQLQTSQYLSVPYEYDVRIFKNRVNDLILSHKVM